MQCNFRIPIGERGYHIFGNEFHGKIKIHLRKLYPKQNTGELYPSKEGLSLNLDEWMTLTHPKTQNTIRGHIESMAKEQVRPGMENKRRS